MKLTVLGSGSAFSGGERATSGYLLQTNKDALVLDLGYGAFKNLQKVISPSEVNTLLFTHFSHSDNVADLLGFIEERFAYTAFRGREKKQLTIVGPKGMKGFFAKVQQLFPSFSQLPFKVVVNEVDYAEKKMFEFLVKSKPVKHTPEAIGYRLQCKGKTIAYSGDSAYCDNLLDLGKDADLLVLDCSNAKEKTEMHQNALECGETAQKAKAKKLILTHFFPEAEKEDLVALAAKSFKGEILLAEDLMQVEI